MVKKIYTEEQRAILLKNKNIASLSKGVIRYASDFKIKALQQSHQQYLPPQEIFTQAGFNLEIIGKNSPKERLKEWNKIYSQKGFQGLQQNNKRKEIVKIKSNSNQDKIKRLEAEVIYLKAENDFLVKLRAKRKY